MSYQPDQAQDSLWFKVLSEGLRESKDQHITPWSVNLKTTFGEKVAHRTEEAFERYRRAIVILSRAYIEDEWFKDVELVAFHAREEKIGSPFIVPVVIDDCPVPVLLRNRILDLRNRKPEEGVTPLLAHLSTPPQAFVVMPFADPELQRTFERTIKPAAEKFGYSVRQGRDFPLVIHEHGNTPGQVLKAINDSDIVLVELTDQRPSVCVEAGYALALGKPIIFMIRKGQKIPFDLVVYEFIEWDDEKHLRKRLEQRLTELSKPPMEEELRKAA